MLGLGVFKGKKKNTAAGATFDRNDSSLVVGGKKVASTFTPAFKADYIIKPGATDIGNGLLVTG